MDEFSIKKSKSSLSSYVNPRDTSNPSFDADIVGPRFEVYELCWNRPLEESSANELLHRRKEQMAAIIMELFLKE